MKYLICYFHDNNVDKLLNHYVGFHNIERTNYCLKALLEPDVNSVLETKRNICDEVFHTDREIKNQNFLKHF